MDFMDLFERLPIRGVFPALRPYVSNYETARIVYWLAAASAVMICLTLLSWAIDRFLKSRGFR